MLFNNWNISGCVKFRMLDNKTSSFDVAGDIPEGWSWQLLYSCNGNLNIAEMQHEENILSVIFTKEMLPTDGTYLFQLKATKDDLVKHTNIVKSYVNKSLSGDIKWPVIPTEFTQIEQVVKGYAESAKESEINAAESATKAENAAVHSPIVGENGNWFIWDFEKSEYIDSGKPASIGGGTDPSLGITGATVGQIAKITAVDTDGKPTAWEPVDAAGAETWEKIAEIVIPEGADESTALTINKDSDGNPFSLVKARLCAKFPKYTGATTIPNFSFAMLNGKTSGRVTPLAYTSVWPKVSASIVTGTVYEIDVSGAQQIEHVIKSENGGWSDDSTRDYVMYGATHDIDTSRFGDTLWAKPITSIGGSNMLIYPWCRFVLYGVRA